jgi:hypothetical protein
LCGQHPPAPQDVEPGHGAPEEQAKSPPPFPMDMPPMRDMSFSVFFEAQTGHGTASDRLLDTISSNAFPHSSQRYSKIGIDFPSFHCILS